MKIDRLLSIVMYLLNREVVSARELAEHYEVSVRTIQRDMDALTFAGIPIMSVKGPHGGFGIMKSYKLDRQLISTNDLYFMLTSLESISVAFRNKEITETLEKVQTLARDYQKKEIDSRKDKLYIDFSDISIGAHGQAVFQDLEMAIDEQRLIEFCYTDSNYKPSQRVLEPMTIAFKWFSWYLFGFCHKRQDYRLFRLSRIRSLTVLKKKFERRDLTFDAFLSRPGTMDLVNMKLKFDPSLRIQIEDYFRGCQIADLDDGFTVEIQAPFSEGLFNMILGYGDKVEVLEPESMREALIERCGSISKIYRGLK